MGVKSQLPSRPSWFQAGLKHAFFDAPAIEYPRKTNVYNSGDLDERIFYIERGLVKTTATSYCGNQCLLDIHGNGDCFGELCLSGGERFEAATVMKRAVLRSLPRVHLIRELEAGNLMEEFVKYLATSLKQQQQVITDFVTVDSQKRLAAALLRLAQKLGKPDPEGVRIDEKISIMEISEMVGTTRSRVGFFLKDFRSRNMVQVTAKRSLILHKPHLLQYLRDEPAQMRHRATGCAARDLLTNTLAMS